MKKTKSWYLYIILTEKGALYTGITTDLERRFSEHAMDKKKGAKFFRSTKPVKIVFTKKFKNRSLASKFEAKVKKMKREEKLKLCGNSI